MGKDLSQLVHNEAFLDYGFSLSLLLMEKLLIIITPVCLNLVHESDPRASRYISFVLLPTHMCS